MAQKDAAKFLRFRLSVRSRLFGALPGIAGDLSGAELEELRLYEPGDPPTSVNHVASQFINELVVSIRRPERELKIVLLLDTTPSMKAFAGHSKEALMRDLVCAAREVAVEYQARMSCFYQEQNGTITEVPLARGSEELLVRELEQFCARHVGKTEAKSFNMKEALQYFLMQGRGRTLYLVIVSDFFFVANYKEELKKFLAAGHTASAACVLDRVELDFPESRFGAVRVRDSETGKSALLKRPSRDVHREHEALWGQLRSAFAVFSNEGVSR